MASTTYRDPIDPTAGEAAWLAVVLVAVGIFAAVTSELMPVGLLVAISETLSVSIGVAGLTVTAPGLMAAVAAPATAVLLRRIDRRVLLCAALALLTSANALSAVAIDFSLLVFARLLVGISIGVFWALAAGLAVRLVPESAVPRATTIVFAGVSVAAVVGVPAGALLGDLVGWRGAFAAVSGFGLVATLALAISLPPLPALYGPRLDLIGLAIRHSGGSSRLDGGRLSGDRPLRRLHLPGADHRTSGGLGERPKPAPDDLRYGGRARQPGCRRGARPRRPGRPDGDRSDPCRLHLRPAVPGVGSWGVLLAAGSWGLAWGGVSVSLQTKLMRSVPEHVEAATGLFVSVFNLSICIGAILGGFVIDHLGARTLPAVAGCIVLLASAVFFSPTRRGSGPPLGSGPIDVMLSI